MPVAVVAAATATARSGCCRQRAAATAASLVVAGAGGGARRGVVPGRQWRRYYYCYRRSSRRCVSGSNYGYCDTGSSSGNTNCRHFSTRVDGDTTGEDAAANAGGSTAKAEQPFVQTRLQAGEWDEDRTDPLYRPKWKSRARIVSAEDFANRPSVGFSGEFESFQEAMVTLSWFDDREQKQIYQLYSELLTNASQRYGATSHEYVCRIVANKFNVTSGRVAAIVQLQHNEERYKAETPDRKLLTEAAEYMDRAVKQEILDAYQTFGLKKPDEFVEDPVGSSGAGRKESKQYRTVEDLFDVDQLLEDALVREDRDARLVIDGHVYIEDKDDGTVNIPMSEDAKKLVEARRAMTKESEKKEVGSEVSETKSTASTTTSSTSLKIPWPETNGDGTTRPRWKYVAQTVNTRELKKKRAKNRSYRNDSPADTLVEEDGELRVATLEDVKLTSWKPVRHVLEHTYAGAKKGWLDRSVRGKQSAWGKAPAVAARAPLRDVVAEEAAKDGGDDDNSSSTKKIGDDGSSSDYTSSSDSEGSSGEDGAESADDEEADKNGDVGSGDDDDDETKDSKNDKK